MDRQQHVQKGVDASWHYDDVEVSLRSYPSPFARVSALCLRPRTRRWSKCSTPFRHSRTRARKWKLLNTRPSCGVEMRTGTLADIISNVLHSLGTQRTHRAAHEYVRIVIDGEQFSKRCLHDSQSNSSRATSDRPPAEDIREYFPTSFSFHHPDILTFTDAPSKPSSMLHISFLGMPGSHISPRDRDAPLFGSAHRLDYYMPPLPCSDSTARWSTHFGSIRTTGLHLRSPATHTFARR